MSHRFRAPIVILLVCTSIFGAGVPALGAASGITYEFVASSGTGDQESELQLYVFRFSSSSGLTLQSYPEPLLVQVVSGTFGLLVEDEGTAFIDAGSNKEIHFLDTAGDVLEHEGEPCQQHCAVPAGMGNAIVVEAGSVVHQFAPSSYSWCNLGSETAELQVAVKVSQEEEFSWAQDATGASVGLGSASRAWRMYANGTGGSKVLGCQASISERE